MVSIQVYHHDRFHALRYLKSLGIENDFLEQDGPDFYYNVLLYEEDALVFEIAGGEDAFYNALLQGTT